MIFSSVIFLWIFLPCVIGSNYVVNLVPFKSEKSRLYTKNVILLVFSFVFYAWGGLSYLLIMISSIILNYSAGIIMHKVQNDANKKVVLIIAILLNLFILLYFKYFNMILAIIESIKDNLNAEDGNIFINLLLLKRTHSLGIKDVVLPIGISFFTFQSMSYVIDYYRGKCELQKDIVKFALYVSFFPQLIAGPIVRYSDIEASLSNRNEDLDSFIKGFIRFAFGLGKKVIIANTFAQIVDQIWGLYIPNLGSVVSWWGAILYTLQIYFDFSGYSDMAIGLGLMFGFKFPENFNHPYKSTSITDFWRRWHISLSSWFKEYVYIPLGGNRKGVLKTYRNLIIVFLITGIWHGANFTFILWGIYYGIILIIEKLFFKKWLDKNPIKAINWVYSMLIVLTGWVLFRSDNIIQAVNYLEQMFSFKESIDYNITSYLSGQVVCVFVISVFCLPVFRKIHNILCLKSKNDAMIIVDVLLAIAVYAFSVMMLSGDSYNPFIYFQF